MEKNEIVINGVHHVLVDDMFYDCDDCSLNEICINSIDSVHETLCRLVYKENCIDKHFEIKEEK